jgi:lipopolysaccharide transport system permease protein
VPIKPSIWMVLFPVLVLQTGLVGLGVGLWLSALTVKYKDLRFALPFIAQLWMFATPIFYSTSGIVSQKWRVLVALNPMAAPVALTRSLFLGVGTVDAQFIIIGVVSGLFMLISGLIVFNRVQRTFVDTI